MARKYSSNSSGNVMTVILVLIVVVVLGLGVFAVSSKVSDNLRQNRLDAGSMKIADLADQAGMEVEDYLAEYGLTSEDGITGKSEPAEMAEKLTLENYSKFYWGREMTDDEFNGFKASQEIGDDVTKDTKDSEVKSKYNTYASEKQAEEQAAEQAAQESAAAGEADTSVDVTTDEAAESAAE